MLIDFVTAQLRYKDCPDWGGWRRLALWGDRVCRICRQTGAVVWERVAWDSIRSDSHQISIYADGGVLRICGSPARVLGSGDTVFGFGDAGRDLRYCVDAMVDFVKTRICLSDVPDIRLWSVSRVDVTCNYYLGSLPNVRIALKELSGTDGGRYRVSQTAGDTVYWSNSSALRSGKAYAKGPHLRYMVKQPTYTGFRYSSSDLDLADGLVRLEYSLKRIFFYRLRKSGVAWYNLKWSDLFGQYSDFFGCVVGTVEAVDMSSHLERLMEMPHYNNPQRVVTESLAKAILRTLYSIQSIGRQATREMMPDSTWYVHLKYLRQLGYGDADLVKGNISYLRRQIIMSPVSSWDDLRKVA